MSETNEAVYTGFDMANGSDHSCLTFSRRLPDRVEVMAILYGKNAETVNNFTSAQQAEIDRLTKENECLEKRVAELEQTP